MTIGANERGKKLYRNQGKKKGHKESINLDKEHDWNMRVKKKQHQQQTDGEVKGKAIKGKMRGEGK